MSAIRVDREFDHYSTIPDWVVDAMVGLTFGIDSSRSNGINYAVGSDGMEHSLRYSDSDDGKKEARIHAADWLKLYFQLQGIKKTGARYFYVPADACTLLP